MPTFEEVRRRLRREPRYPSAEAMLTWSDLRVDCSAVWWDDDTDPVVEAWKEGRAPFPERTARLREWGCIPGSEGYVSVARQIATRPRLLRAEDRIASAYGTHVVHCDNCRWGRACRLEARLAKLLDYRSPR